MFRWQTLDTLPTQDNDDATGSEAVLNALFGGDDWLQRDWDESDSQPVERETTASMTDHDLLTREQEVALATDLDDAFAQLREILELADDTDRDTLLEQAGAVSVSHPLRRHIQRLLDQITRSRNQLVTSNIRLVYYAARKYLDKGMEMDDMVQEGVLGLMRAAIKFDAGVGVRFSTYAYWWIQQAIRQAIGKQRSLIRYPANVTMQVNRMYAFMQHYRLQTGQKASATLIQQNTGLPETTVSDLLQLSNLCLSANAPVHEDESGQLLDTLRDDDSLPPPHFAAEVEEIREHIQHSLTRLNERERRIVMLKYGIGYRKAYSLDEIAPQIGVTRERVRQLLDEAMTKLKQLPSLTQH